jgi:hypothetical protein
VGIGIESGEAVELGDGTFRGAALNVAARLCGRAHGGEVLVTAGTSRLAGRLTGLQYVDQGKVRLKNIPDPIQIFKVYSELGVRPDNRWVLMFFGKPGRALSWRFGAVVALIAAGTAAAVVFLTTNDHGEGGKAAPRPATTAQSAPLTPATPVANPHLAQLVPAELFGDCRLQTVPDPSAVETAVCLPQDGVPDRWQISVYRSGSDLDEAYATELARHPEIKRDTGKCNAFVWGGERPWLHGPGKPGGRVFCYFDGDDAVVVWTHARRDSRTTETSSRSRARAAATTRASPTGGGRGTTGSARRAESRTRRGRRSGNLSGCGGFSLDNRPEGGSRCRIRASPRSVSVRKVVRCGACSGRSGARRISAWSSTVCSAR